MSYSRYYVCPFCCKQVEPERFHRVCKNGECTSLFLMGGKPADKKRRASKYHPGMEIDIEASINAGIDPHSPDAIVTKDHIVYFPRDGIRCDICGKELPDALCPICHNKVPANDTNNSNIILVLGALNSGKSYYIASLINTLLSEYTVEFDVEMIPSIAKTDENFRLLCDRLKKGEGDTSISDPMVYYIKDRKTGQIKQTLAFFDTQAIDVSSINYQEKASTNALISGAAGIIFLIDPTSLPKVAKVLGTQETKDNNPVRDINDIADTIRAIRKQRNKDVQMPLAVVMVKSDLILRMPTKQSEEEVFLGPESALNIPRNRGYFDEENMMQIDVEVGEYLSRMVGEDFKEAVQRFTPHAYFGVSSLGHKLSSNVAPAPFRVEDPIIWLINGNHDSGSLFPYSSLLKTRSK